MTFALRAWTGPTLVHDVATMLREAGVHVACEGTEHVFVTAEGTSAEGAAWNVLVDLRRTHGADAGLTFRPV